MTINASFTASSNVGTVTYNWTINQTLGTSVSGVSVTTGSNAVVITYPNTLTWAGSSAVTGTYRFTLQGVAIDAGVASCNQVKTIYVWFNDTPPTCTLTLSDITLTSGG